MLTATVQALSQNKSENVKQTLGLVRPKNKYETAVSFAAVPSKPKYSSLAISPGAFETTEELQGVANDEKPDARLSLNIAF
jgi:hypothetical protein